MAKSDKSKKSGAAADIEEVQTSMDIIDMILLDHKYLKECIEVLSSEDTDRRKVLSQGKGFLEVLEKHSLAEEKSIYKDLQNEKEFKFNILESEIEHGIVDQKVKMLKRKVASVRTASDELAAEFKVLSELVKHHVREEESELLPKIREELDEEELQSLGKKFSKVRKFTAAEVSEFPQLSITLANWKGEMEKMSQNFVTKMDKYVEALKG